jgi:hypothetical protein
MPQSGQVALDAGSQCRPARGRIDFEPGVRGTYEQQVTLIQTAGSLDFRDAPANDEQGIAHNGERQPDLQGDQQGAGLVPTQGGENRTNAHGCLLSRFSVAWRAAHG